MITNCKSNNNSKYYKLLQLNSLNKCMPKKLKLKIEKSDFLDLGNN